MRVAYCFTNFPKSQGKAERSAIQSIALLLSISILVILNPRISSAQSDFDISNKIKIGNCRQVCTFIN